MPRTTKSKTSKDIPGRGAATILSSSKSVHGANDQRNHQRRNSHSVDSPLSHPGRLVDPVSGAKTASPAPVRSRQNLTNELNHQLDSFDLQPPTPGIFSTRQVCKRVNPSCLYYTVPATNNYFEASSHRHFFSMRGSCNSVFVEQPCSDAVALLR